MEIELVDDAEKFAARVTDFVTGDPFSTNVVSIVAARTVAGDQVPTPDDRWIVVLDEGGAVVGIGMANAPYNVFLSRLPPGAASLVAERLHRDDLDQPGVTGERAAAEEFADRWRARRGVRSVVQIEHCVYRLDRLVTPNGLTGAARRAAPSDTATIAEWLDAFHDEALPHDPVIDHVALAKQRIEAGEVWCWADDETIVAMAACSAPAAGVARIGPVYTPPERRSHGYGAGATHAATEAALEAGADHVMLYADRANPISNALYRRLGFIPDHDAVDLGFRSVD